MDRFKTIEEKLQRLVPPVLSEDGLERMNETIDHLARTDDVSRESLTKLSTKRFTFQTLQRGKVAAIVVALVIPTVMIHSWLSRSRDTSLAVNEPQLTPGVPTQMVLLRSSNVIDARENDGLIVPYDGAAPHYRYRYHIIDEAQVQDPETGAVITLRQPRQEVVTIPVTQF